VTEADATPSDGAHVNSSWPSVPRGPPLVSLATGSCRWRAHAAILSPLAASPEPRVSARRATAWVTTWHRLGSSEPSSLEASRIPGHRSSLECVCVCEPRSGPGPTATTRARWWWPSCQCDARTDWREGNSCVASWSGAAAVYQYTVLRVRRTVLAWVPVTRDCPAFPWRKNFDTPSVQ